MNLRPGALKQARKEAGLTLAQVAEGHVTAPAIYLIETGQARPSMPTLEHISRRTGKDVDFFLADPGHATNEARAGLVELEATLAEGRFADAIALGLRLIAVTASAHHVASVRYFLAQAHLQMGQTKQAGPLVREARANFEAVDDRVMLAECLGLEATLAYMTQNQSAKALAERALAMCRSVSPVPQATEARLLAILATVHVANRKWQPAIELYEEAIAAAGALQDLRHLAKMYNGLSFAYRQAGNVESATRFAHRAIVLYEVLRDRVRLSWAENNLGLILLAQGQKLAARQHLDRSLELSDEAHLEVGRSHLLLSFCELCLEEGNLQAGRQFAEQALRLASRLHEAANVAEAHVCLGRLAAETGEHAVADTEFDLAVRGLSEVGVDERLLRCHRIYAEILEKRGNLKKASMHMKKVVSAGRPGLPEDVTDETSERASSA